MRQTEGFVEHSSERATQGEAGKPYLVTRSILYEVQYPPAEDDFLESCFWEPMEKGVVRQYQLYLNNSSSPQSLFHLHSLPLSWPTQAIHSHNLPIICSHLYNQEKFLVNQQTWEWRGNTSYQLYSKSSIKRQLVLSPSLWTRSIEYQLALVNSIICK